jgi:hypothetical protein
MASDYLIAFPGLTSHDGSIDFTRWLICILHLDGISARGALLVALTKSVVGNTGLHCFPSEFGICDIGCPRIKVCQVLNTHSCGQSPSETTLINRGQSDTFKESRYSTRSSCSRLSSATSRSRIFSSTAACASHPARASCRCPNSRS